MAFKKIGSLDPYGGPLTRKQVAENSLVVTVTDSVRATNRGFALGVASSAVLGHVQSITRRDGVGVETDGTAGAATGSFTGTFTFSANNLRPTESAGADIDISQSSLYSADMSAALDTTPASSAFGQYFELTDEQTLNEASVVPTTAQYHSWGVDPEDSTNLIVNVFESSVFQSTA